MNWFDIVYHQRRQEEIAERFRRIEIRSAAEAAEAEEAAAKNNNKPQMSDLDFQIGRNAFERRLHNGPNDGEWQRWSRDIREQHQHSN
jgi:hypothetical protein